MTIHLVVLDPPYPDDPGNVKAEDKHNNPTNASIMNHAAILRHYDIGVMEAVRVLTREGGQI